MAVKYTSYVSLFVSFLSVCGVSFAEISDVGSRESAGIEIKCGEVEVRITVKRQFFEEKRIPFKPDHVRLGVNSTQQRSCGAQGPVSDLVVISAGLHQCGTQSTVHGEWLVYSNQLVLSPPAVVPTSTGSVIVKGPPTVIIPVECHYKSMNGHLSPCALQWTGDLSRVYLAFAQCQLGSAPEVLCQKADSEWRTINPNLATHDIHYQCLWPSALLPSHHGSSSVYQQGEAVFLEASVEAPLHHPLALYVDSCVATLKPDPLSSPSYKFITKHGCLMDSILPGSSSKFLPREQHNRLCFSVQAFHFHQESGEQMFISCHIRATLKQNSHSHHNKACVFHRPTFSWRATEGDNALCGCCDSDDCFGQTGHTNQPDTEKKHEADTTVGPLLTLPRSHWTGRLSVHH